MTSGRFCSCSTLFSWLARLRTGQKYVSELPACPRHHSGCKCPEWSGCRRGASLLRDVVALVRLDIGLSVTPSQTIVELEHRQGVEPNPRIPTRTSIFWAGSALSGSASPGQLHANLSVISTAEFFRMVTSRALNSQQI